MVAHDGEDAISKQSGERFFDGTDGRAPDRLSQSSGPRYTHARVPGLDAEPLWTARAKHLALPWAVFSTSMRFLSRWLSHFCCWMSFRRAPPSWILGRC